MKNIIWIIAGLLLALAFYFIGKNAGKNNVRTEMVQNISIIKEIAELAGLEVDGNTQITVSNAGTNSGFWKRFKNYFAENTLKLSVPYQAKYGVDMGSQQIKIDTKKKKVIVYLPHAKLLSLQLELDKVDALSKTGLLYSSSFEEYISAQKQLYKAAHQSLVNNQNHIKLAENHISFILEKYYQPLGLEVTCIFGKEAPDLGLP